MEAVLSFGSLKSSVILLLLSGLFLLLIEVKIYSSASEYKKEEKASRILGWFNIILGAFIWLLTWGYETIFW